MFAVAVKVQYHSLWQSKQVAICFHDSIERLLEIFFLCLTAENGKYLKELFLKNPFLPWH